MDKEKGVKVHPCTTLVAVRRRCMALEDDIWLPVYGVTRASVSTALVGAVWEVTDAFSVVVSTTLRRSRHEEP